MRAEIVWSWLCGFMTAIAATALTYGLGSMPRWFYWVGLALAVALSVGGFLSAQPKR
jgi:hypothetical protein